MATNLYGESCTPNLGGVQDFYTKAEVNQLLGAKANTSTTYTRAYLDSQLATLSSGIASLDADKIDQAQLDTALTTLQGTIEAGVAATYATLAGTYTISQVDSLIAAIDLDPADYIRSAPTNTLQNTIYPGTADAIALTVRGSSTNPIVTQWLDSDSNVIGYITNSGTVSILGDLEVQGTTTTIDQISLTIEDKNVILSSNATNPSQSDGSGIIVNGSDARFLYNDTASSWESNISIQSIDGTSNDLAYTFASDVGTGIYLNAPGQLSFATNYLERLRLSDTQLALTGDLSFKLNLAILSSTGLTAERTFALPDVSGSLVTTGDTGTITGTMIANETITNDDISVSAGISDVKLDTISTANKVAISALDIDNGVDIGEDLSDLALFIVDNSGNGTNRKVDATRITDYVFGKISSDISISNNGTASISSEVIIDGDISPTAEIAVSKLADGSARQLLQTDAAGTGVEWTSNVDVPGTLDVTGVATFDTKISIGAAEPATSQEVGWNTDKGTLDVGLLNGVISPYGQDIITLCRNNTASTISKGAAVMFTGTIGNSGLLTVAPMVSDGTYPGYVFLGVAAQNIAVGADGYVRSFGEIKGVDTDVDEGGMDGQWAEGDILWCDPATPGGFTKFEPLAPNLKLPVAAVVSVGNNGILFVRWDSGRRLQDLHDVDANGATTDGDLLQYSAVNSRWEHRTNIDLPGTLDVTGIGRFDSDVIISGDLTVSGTTTTVNSQTLTVTDKNAILGNVDTPTDITADGGGITLKGTTDKTFNWVDATDSWTSSEHVDLASGKSYRINGTEVLSSTTLGSGVTGSSLTSVGTLGSLTVTGSATAGTFIPTSGTAPTNGLYLPSANSVAISTNGTRRLIITSDGKVGLGSASVLQQGSAIDGGSGAGILELYNGATGNTTLENTGAFPIIFKTNGSERMRLDSSGRLGLGTSSPGFKLTIEDATTPRIRIGDGTRHLNVDGGSTTQNAAIGTDYAGSFGIYTNGAANTRLHVTSAGNVGIGTTSPGNALHVVGNIQVGSTSDTIYSSNFGNYSSASDLSLISGSASLLFKTGAANDERARITLSGQLLVGTSTSLTGGTAQYSKIQAIGNSANTAGNAVVAIGRGTAATSISSGNAIGSLFFTDNGAGEFASIECFADATPGASDYPGRLVFSTTADGASSPTERMRIDSSGRVGIGTGSPGATLAVDSSSAGLMSTYNSTNANGGYIELRSSGTVYGDIGTAAQLVSSGSASDFCLNGRGSRGLALGTNNVSRLYINSSGNVGIGTTSPNERVDAGSGNFVTSGYYICSSSGRLRLRNSNNNNYSEIYNPETGSGAGIAFVYGGGEAARIDSSGRLLVGTSSSTTGAEGQYAKLQVIGNSSGVGGGAYITFGKDEAATGITADEMIARITFGNTGPAEFAYISCQADGTAGSGDYPGRLVFSTTADGASSPTERMRIRSSGGIVMFGNEDPILKVNSARGAGTSDRLYQGCYSATGTTDGIYTNGTVSFQVFTNGNVQNTNNSYGAISDVKLKENIVDATSQWDDIKALQVRKYNFKEGQTHTQIGLLAQEVELVSPGLVNESPDRDEDGNDLGTVTKSVNYSVLYMKAVKALQEAMERIETLETEMAAVKAQLS